MANVTGGDTMNAPAPSSLPSDTLARRLGELAGEERNVQVDFLLHLDEFDRRRAFLELGHDSLWSYCLRALHLREGPAGRRIGAMRVLRRFPALEAPLRDGRLCLSTVTLLGPLLATDTLDELVALAAYRTKADVEHLVATINPRTAPKDGVRKVPERRENASHGSSPQAEPLLTAQGTRTPPAPVPCAASAMFEDPAPSLAHDLLEPGASRAVAAAPPVSGDASARAEGGAHPHALRRADVATPRPVEFLPISAEEWSLRVTIDGPLKADLETLRNLLSHSTGGDLAAVLREAIRCAIEKHGRRKGMVKPARQRTPSPEGQERVPGSRTVPAAARRQVWERDGGCCTWLGTDGRRCGSRWKLELDHVRPVALGGASTADNVRILCRRHNVLHAAQVFGRDHMARFERRSLIPG
jgi:5-methylcytosine-specific restriction endonuclease McrA